MKVETQNLECVANLIGYIKGQWVTRKAMTLQVNQMKKVEGINFAWLNQYSRKNVIAQRVKMTFFSCISINIKRLRDKNGIKMLPSPKRIHCI